MPNTLPPEERQRLLKDLSVLLVEDERLTRTFLENALRAAVGSVLSAEDGQAGLFQFARAKPDVVVADLHLPKMDGIAMIRAMLRIRPDTPFIVITAFEDMETISQAIALGVGAYLVKPIEPPALLEALAACAANLHQGRELARQKTLTQLMLDGSPFPTMLLDIETERVLAANEPARRLGFAPGDPCRGPFFAEGFFTGLRDFSPFAGLKKYEATRSREIEAFGRTFLVSWSQPSGDTILFTAADITERRKAEEGLRESEATLRTILMSLPAGVILVDAATHTIVDANAAALRMIGTDIEGVRGRVCTDCFCPAQAGRCPITELGLTVDNAERELCTRDGRRIPILKTVVQVALRGRPHLLESFVDISEQKKLAQLKEDVDRMARHDLKAPLTAFIGLPEVLIEDDNLTEEQRNVIEIIRQAGLKMLGMINLSLDLFKMESGTYRFEPKPVDLLAVLRRIKGETDRQTRITGQTLEVRVDGREVRSGEGFPVLGEELLCYSMLANLVKNAVEASPPRAAVTVNLWRDPGAKVAVCNQGEVPPEIRDRFFEKYATAGKKQGTGLGTYSAKLIARTHGGDVALDTSEPGFTSVIVSFPAEK